MWMGSNARNDTESAVRSVSLLYLDELAGRREQVVSANMQEKINVIHTALDLMTGEDLSDGAHLQAYQARIKQLFNLERFAFVSKNGLIYTSTGPRDESNLYHLDFNALSGPEILAENLGGVDKKVIIAVPTRIRFNDEELSACFMQINPRASESHLPGMGYAAAGTLAAAILYILSLLTAALGLALARKERARWPRVAGWAQLAAAVILIFPLREYALLDLSPMLAITILYLCSLPGKEKA